MAVQAVAWLPGRSDTLAALFSISSFIMFMNFMNTAKSRYFFLHLVLLLLAFFSKENTLCLVIICFIYTRLVLKERLFSAKENFLLLGWFAALSAFLLLRHIALVDPLKLTLYEMLRYIAVNLLVIIHYIGRIFFPLNLSVWPTIQDSQWVPGLIAIVILAGMVFFSKNKRPGYVIFGILWFIIFLLPALVRPNAGVSGVFSNTRVYLSMAGLLMVLGETDIFKYADIRKWRHAVTVLLVFAFYYLAALEHSYDFMNGSAFWANARRTSPHSWIDPSEIKKN